MITIKKDNLVGQQFGRWTVIKQSIDYISPKGKREPQWLCKCTCGKYSIIRSHMLKSGHSKSCGCYKKDLRIQNNRKYNTYEFNEEKGYVSCATQKGIVFYIDIDDLDNIKNYYWEVNANGYLRAIIDNSEFLLHRFITGCPDNLVVDHINHNKLDNRRCNLRVVTVQQNLMNRKVLGIYWDKSSSKWSVEIGCNGKRYRLGKFKTYQEALSVRKQAERDYYGEYSFENSQKIGEENDI